MCIMTFIWINPVTASLYPADDLNAFLKRNGYQRVEASPHWPETVREKYKRALETTDRTVIDMRCPKIAERIDLHGLRENVTLPAIEPILIHCGREISEREDLRGTEKLITTPCQALADFGNSLGLKETKFLPWNLFLSAFDDAPAASPLESSPIPPGFFAELNCRKISVTEKAHIDALFRNFPQDTFDLIELLYCKNGCHNGDGIR